MHRGTCWQHPTIRRMAQTFGQPQRPCDCGQSEEHEQMDNGHPFKCRACGNCFTTERFAKRCCREGSTDLRSGLVTFYTDEAEKRAQEEEDARWAAIAAASVFECSCGERWESVPAAIRCRKCRTYTEQGFCSEVLNLETGSVAWRLWGG